MKDNSKPDIFDFWIDLNDNLWHRWAAFCTFPVKNHFLHTICFGHLSAWNRLIDQMLAFQYKTVLPSTERAILENPIFKSASSEEFVEHLLKSAEDLLPNHSEFDTLIYPWRDAERHAVQDEAAQDEVYHEVSKVA